MSAATTWACYPHGTRVVQEDEPTFDCVEADRSGCSWERVGSAGCQLDGCAGLNPDGVCPNDYGVTCELVFAEPSNMDDDPLRAPVDWDELADRRWREERGLRMKSAACICTETVLDVDCPIHGGAAAAIAVEAIDRGQAIMAQPPGRCELCGAVEETRPYGPNGEEVCFSCGMKDEAAAKAAFDRRFA